MRRIAVVLAGFLACATPVVGQSLFGARGLGVPLEATDARARVLGGLGIGLLGLDASLVNPASAAGTLRRGISAVMVSAPRTLDLNGQTGYATSTRFPLVRVVYPFATRWVATLAYGGYLDQSWAVRTNRMEAIGADTVPVQDNVQSTGGVAQYRFSLAYSLGSRLALGVAAGGYSGQQLVTLNRQFTDTTALTVVESFRSRLGRSYGAPLVAVGVRWDPFTFARVGASVTMSGDLSVKAEQQGFQDVTVPMPLQVAGGASAYLSTSLLMAASARWNGWSVADAALRTASTPAGVPAARDTWEVGGGLEYASAGRQGRALPLRVGFRWAQLPFSFDGQLPSEWAVGGGLGLRLGPSLDPRVMIDLGVQRGVRGSTVNGGLQEKFWEISLSASLFSR